MIDLTSGKDKLIALELLKELKNRFCQDCQKKVDSLVLEIAYQ